MKRLEKQPASQRKTIGADRSSGVYDEITDGYDKINQYVDLVNDEDNVSGTPAAGYDHLKERSTAYSKPYDKLIDQQADDKSPGDVETQEKIDPLLIEPYAKFSEADKIKAQLPKAEEGMAYSAASPKKGSALENLYAQVNKRKHEKLDETELTNQPGASSTASTLEAAGNDAENSYFGLGTSDRKDDTNAKREYTSLASGVNSPNATPDADSIANDSLTQEGKHCQTLAPDKMKTLNRSAPASSFSYVPLARDNGKNYTALDLSQKDTESHATVDYTPLKVDFQSATQAYEKCKPSPYTQLKRNSYEALNQRELDKPDKAVTSAYTSLTEGVEKE